VTVARLEADQLPGRVEIEAHLAAVEIALDPERLHRAAGRKGRPLEPAEIVALAHGGQRRRFHRMVERVTDRIDAHR
jgi:hypothetical protein